LSSTTSPSSGVRRNPWLKLVRIPAVFTVIAQVAAAFLLMSGTVEPVARLVTILFSAVALYWGGMILNDVFDVEEDRRERPTRPLPAGEISVRSASLVGWSLLAVGVALAAAAGFVNGNGVASTSCPAIVGLATAVCIWLYNGPLKTTLIAPLAMGLCRAFCFLLGASPLVNINGAAMFDVVNWFPGHVIAAAVGMGIYVMGITTISRSETLGGHAAEMISGVVTIVLGAVCVALSPRFAPAETEWLVSPGNQFPILVGLVVCSVVFRGVRVILRPEPAAIQNLIRVGLMTLIPLAAAVAMLSAGPRVGLAIFALVIPAIAAAARFRVT